MTYMNRGDQRKSGWCSCDQCGRTGRGTRRAGDLMSGTLAAAAYWDCIGVLKEEPI